MKYAALRKLPDADLESLYDAAAQHAGTGGLSFLRDELARRENDRQTARMIRLTWAITAMTAAVVVLTVLNVVLVWQTL